MQHSPSKRATILCANALASVVSVLLVTSGAAQDTTARRVVVTGEELPSAYGAPPAFSRTRFAPTTTAYVLPPGAFLAATIWQGDFEREGSSYHQFTQEFEVGLPHRFGLAAEFAFDEFEGTSQ